MDLRGFPFAPSGHNLLSNLSLVQRRPIWPSRYVFCDIQKTPIAQGQRKRMGLPSLYLSISSKEALPSEPQVRGWHGNTSTDLAQTVRISMPLFHTANAHPSPPPPSSSHESPDLNSYPVPLSHSDVNAVSETGRKTKYTLIKVQKISPAMINRIQPSSLLYVNAGSTVFFQGIQHPNHVTNMKHDGVNRKSYVMKKRAMVGIC